MADYKCQDKDCGKVCSEDGPLYPLVFTVPAHTYRKDDPLLKNYKWPHPTDTITYPGYHLLKCPYCRGNLMDVLTGESPGSIPLL